MTHLYYTDAQQVVHTVDEARLKMMEVDNNNLLLSIHELTNHKVRGRGRTWTYFPNGQALHR